VLSNCYEKCNQSQSQAGKKKKNNGVITNHASEVLTGKEKLTLVVEVMTELRTALNTCESSLGKKRKNVQKSCN
jgi:hypothetical protein